MQNTKMMNSLAKLTRRCHQQRIMQNHVCLTTHTKSSTTNNKAFPFMTVHSNTTSLNHHFRTYSNTRGVNTSSGFRITDIADCKQYIQHAISNRAYKRANVMLYAIEDALQRLSRETEYDVMMEVDNLQSLFHTRTENNDDNNTVFQSNPANLVHMKIYIFVRIAYCHYQMAEYEQAVTYSNKILALEDDLKRLKLLDHYFSSLNSACTIKSKVLIQRKQFESALKLMNFLIDRRLTKRLNQVMDPTEKSILRRELSDQLYLRASIYHLMGNIGKEQVDLTRSLDLHGSNAKALISRADIHFVNKKFDLAKRDAELCLKLNSNVGVNNRARLLLAAISVLEEKKNGEAIILASECIASDPTNARAYYVRGMCHYHSFNFEQALNDFLEVERLEPSKTSEVFKAHMTCLIHLCRFNEAIEYSDRIISTFCSNKMSDSEKLQVQILAATAKSLYLFWTGKRIEAVDILDECFNQSNNPPLKQNRMPPSYFLEKVPMLIQCGQFFKAAELAEASVNMWKMSPGVASNEIPANLIVTSLANRAWAYSCIGKFDFAACDLVVSEEYVKRSRDTPGYERLLVHLQLMKARVASNHPARITEAIQLCKEAAKLAEQYHLYDRLIFILDCLIPLEREYGLLSQAEMHTQQLYSLFPDYKP